MNLDGSNIENFIIVYGYAGCFMEDEKQAIVEFVHKNKLKTISCAIIKIL